MDLNEIQLDQIFGKWFWYTALGLTVGIVVLTILWYAKHPGRSVFEDFARQSDNNATTNGHVPVAPSVVSSALVEDPESN